MQPPTHPPTQLGEADPTRVVPAEFGGRGGATTEEMPKKPDSRISRRKLLLGVGGLAGAAVAGGGAYFTLGSKENKTGGTANMAVSSATQSATSAPSNADASGPSNSATSSSADTTSASSTASSSASASPSDTPTSTASQAPLTPGSAPIGKIDIPGEPTMVFRFINGGKHMVVSDDANGVQIFDISNPAAPLKVVNVSTPLADGKLQPMLSMDYSPARALLALGGDGGLALWDLKDPTKPVQLSARGDVNGKKVQDLCFNGDGTKLVIATDESNTYSDKPVGNCVFDVTDARQPAQTSALTPQARDNLNLVVFAGGDKYIVSTGHGNESDKAIFQLWDASDIHNVRPVDSTTWWDPNTTKLTAAMYLAFGGPWNTLVLGVAGPDRQSQDMQFLDFRKPQTPVKQWKFTNTSGAVGFHPTRPVTAVGDSRSGAATVYDMTDPNHPVPVSQLGQDAGYVEELGFSPDGTLLAMALKRDGYNSNAVIYFWKM